MVFSSGATRPARAPASIDMLQTVMRPSIDMSRKVLPAYSRMWPVPPAVPILPMMARMTSFGPNPRPRPPIAPTRHRRVEPAHLAAGELQPFEGLRCGDLLDQVKIDVDQVSAFALRGDDMALPDLVEEGARRGHDGTPLFWIGACRRRLGSGAQAGAGALDDARPFAGEAAQIIELRPADHPATHHFDRGDPRRIERKDAFNALAVGDLPQRQVRVHAAVLPANANPSAALSPPALASTHPHP